MNFNRGMQMRYAKTVISCAFLIVANGSLGCSGKIEGQYICGNEFYEFTNENNQNIMNIYKMLSATPSNSKPDIVVPLVKKDDVWEGTVTALLAQFKISVSKSKDGIMIVGAGKKENCIRADQAKLIKQYSEKELDELLKNNIFQPVIDDIENEKRFCDFNKDASKADYFKELFNRITISKGALTEKENRFTKGYSFDATINAPDFNKSFIGVEHCVRRGGWFGQKCRKSEVGNLVLSSKQGSVGLKIDYYLPKYKGMYEKDAAIEIKIIDKNDWKNLTYFLCDDFVKKLDLKESFSN